ncbi:Uncharacterised protein [Mycobacterium tuberculosis]|nr:Uncharacterised protein [Mycobacterium tuberculosis]
MFWLAERGSRFMEPMKMRVLSMAAVLACSRPSDLPNMPKRSPALVRCGLSSYRSAPACSSRSR